MMTWNVMREREVLRFGCYCYCYGEVGEGILVWL